LARLRDRSGRELKQQATLENDAMSHDSVQHGGPSPHRQAALARWDREGGAGPDGPQPHAEQSDGASSVSGEIARLRVRVIALENLTIALLADASPHRVGLIRDMAAFIAPRPGATAHSLTIQAADHMINLVARAEHFREAKSDFG
jgi:hypothetical protein